MDATTISCCLPHLRLRTGHARQHSGKKYALVLLALWASVLYKVVEDAEAPLKVRPRPCRLQQLRHLGQQALKLWKPSCLVLREHCMHQSPTLERMYTSSSSSSSSC